jgi:DNA primase
LRRELLNLAASGSSLENRGLENHLVRKGMAELIARLGHGRSGEPSDMPTEGADAEDTEARFLLAAQQLREMAELEPERHRAAERHKSEATEESWAEYHRLRGFPNE